MNLVIVSKIKKIFQKKEILFLWMFCSVIVLVAHADELSLHISQTHMLDLANSFLHGKITVNLFPNGDDIAFYRGKYYVYFGFFPSLLLIPFILFFHIHSQWGLVPLITILAARCWYLLARYTGLSPKQSVWMIIAFYLGTIYLFLSLVNITAYYIQVIGINFLIIALYFFICEKKLTISSILFCCAFLTRQTLLLAVVFFILEIYFEKRSWKFALRNIVIFSIPVLCSVGILFFYNYIRFGSIINNGYIYNIATKEVPIVDGLFSLSYIPGNIYFMLFKGLDSLPSINHLLHFPYYHANYMGLGIFFTSPFLLYAFLAKLKDKYVVSSLISIFLLMIPIITFYNTGFWQYGYRYALDFYPFLFLILFSVFAKYFTRFIKITIFYSIVFNTFFMFSIWGVYPLLPRLFGFHY